mmetsp:Transcript_18817/g.48309  ORF Transcript_18817/g.48309 Transcript_18817/m.48309 type:complete len:144 (+) Transcript_18817:349-780(+)|eukprot:jgi/Tetstr1/449580/TSEL_036667.t1
MESPLGRSLLGVRTSNQWSLLDAVARKMKVPTAELHAFLDRMDDDTLRAQGLWKQKVGRCYILCANPGYRMAVQGGGVAGRCTCEVAVAGAGGATKAADRYFGSSDYNAGRHAPNASEHRSTCPLWEPPAAGHLHSWRRGYQS